MTTITPRRRRRIEASGGGEAVPPPTLLPSFTKKEKQESHGDTPSLSLGSLWRHFSKVIKSLPVLAIPSLGDVRVRGGLVCFYLTACTLWILSYALWSTQSQRRLHPVTVLLEDEHMVRYPESSFQRHLSHLSRETLLSERNHQQLLEMESLLFQSGDQFRRTIPDNDDDLYNQERADWLEEIDDEDVHSSYYHYEDLEYPRKCVRPQWAYKAYPNCHAFHEFATERDDQHNSLVDYSMNYVASGYYRDTWAVFEPRGTSFVLKRLRFELSFDNTSYDRRFFKTHAEAVVLERLEGSPVITDIYGFCGTNVLVERGNLPDPPIVPRIKGQKYRGRISQSKLDEIEAASSHGVFSLNQWPVPQKLSMLTDMVTGLAEMHNFVGGVIVHDDIKPEQWLVSDDGRFLLGDVNNAVILDWNPKKKEYCKFWMNYGGDLRPPEEFKGAYVDEKVDLWNVGIIIFSVLTGLWPYYTLSDDDDIQEAVMKGDLPYINSKFKTRSLIEGRLVELMYLCFKPKPKERASMSFILEHLLETRRLYDAEQQSRPHKTRIKHAH